MSRTSEATVYLRHDKNGVCFLTPCEKCKQLTAKLEAVRAEAYRAGQERMRERAAMAVPDQWNGTTCGDCVDTLEQPCAHTRTATYIGECVRALPLEDPPGEL